MFPSVDLQQLRQPREGRGEAPSLGPRQSIHRVPPGRLVLAVEPLAVLSGCIDHLVAAGRLHDVQGGGKRRSAGIGPSNEKGRPAVKPGGLDTMRLDLALRGRHRDFR